jgi:hypothetical protein
MRTIHKYPLLVQKVQSVLTHEDAQIIHVAAQGDAVCIWAIVDTDKPPAVIRIGAFSSGVEIPDGMEHFGTALLHEGSTVVHVFQEVQYP